MSLNNGIRNNLKLYLLEKIAQNQEHIASHTAEVFAVSLNTVYRYISELENEGQITKKANGKYFLKRNVITHSINRKGLEDEFEMYKRYLMPVTGRYADNVEAIWIYVFSEMMNNVIDHSMAQNVTVSIVSDYLSTAVLLYDDGVGIFNKIRDGFGLGSTDYAVQELYKGKVSTDTAHHSGEGIFFSSRAMDDFAVISSGKIFSHSKFDLAASEIKELDDYKAWKEMPGTLVFMKLSNKSSRDLSSVFKPYEDDDFQFMRTVIPIRNFFDIFPVSRSQAKILCRGFGNSSEVILDFDGVNLLGQGFADEVFRVFSDSNPEVRICYMNACQDVERMIRHVAPETVKINKTGE